MTDPLRPPETDDEPWAVPGLDRDRSRDLLIVCFAGCAILAILAWVTR